MTRFRRFAARLFALVALASLASVADAAGRGPDPGESVPRLVASEELSWLPVLSIDLRGDEPQPPLRKASLRKANRRLAPPRSVLRSAPNASAATGSGSGFARHRVPAAVQAANAADILRLCRWLL